MITKFDSSFAGHVDPEQLEWFASEVMPAFRPMASAQAVLERAL